MSTPGTSLVPDSTAVHWLFFGVRALLVIQIGLWFSYQLARFQARRTFRRQLRRQKLLPREEFQRIAAELRQGSSNGGGATTPSDEACVICFAKPVVRPVELLPCGHSGFCAQCIVELWKYSRRNKNCSQDGAGSFFRHDAPLICPLCKQVVVFVCPNWIEREPFGIENGAYGNSSNVIDDGCHKRPKESPQPGELINSLDEDDVMLVLRYNIDFLAHRSHQCVVNRVDWWEKTLYRCIWWLSRIIHAKLLPFLVGLRIVLLHMTVFLCFILPSERLVHLTKFTYPSSSLLMSGDTSSKPYSRMNFKFINLLEVPLLWLIYYADDILFVFSCWISIGHISNRLLFWHTNLA
ncbi:unnamed protein product [Phytomonas sp. EM1]|nr:unnamed protein product [Phytomonas sp. EM1]|eukprot:CCW64836.1 unnamed protein product [Phytomonas sp. isolate EM1]